MVPHMPRGFFAVLLLAPLCSANSICGYDGCLRDQVNQNGFAIVRDVFSEQQALSLRQRVLDYFDENFEFIGDSLKGFRVTHVL